MICNPKILITNPKIIAVRIICQQGKCPNPDEHYKITYL